MYISIMKNRQEEMKVITQMNKYFSHSLIPLVEIIRDLPNKNNSPTLEVLNTSLNNKLCFVDFFRFDISEYPKQQIKVTDIQLSLELSRNYQLYKKSLNETKAFANLIPVISLKPNFLINKYDLNNLYASLKSTGKPVAIRFTDDCLDEYIDFFESNLDSTDFLFMDFREKNLLSKEIELDEFSDLITDASKIILNSPRQRDLQNRNYDTNSFTDKINTSAINIYKEYNFKGFGDFGGLKDSLPTKGGGGGGTGCALALIYCKRMNAFYSVMNSDSSQGLKGYKSVHSILTGLPKNILNFHESCEAFKRISAMGPTYGNWATWNNITLTRYIHQQAQLLAE